MTKNTSFNEKQTYSENESNTSGTDIDTSDNDSDNEIEEVEIFKFIEEDNFDEVKNILDNNIKEEILNSRSFNRQTPLIYAAEENQISIFEHLIEAGAEINAMDKYGHTALNYIISWGNLKAAKLLIDRDSVVNPKCYEFVLKGLIEAENYQVLKEFEEILKLLLKHGSFRTFQNIKEAFKFDLSPYSIIAELEKMSEFALAVCSNNFNNELVRTWDLEDFIIPLLHNIVKKEPNKADIIINNIAKIQNAPDSLKNLELQLSTGKIMCDLENYMKDHQLEIKCPNSDIPEGKQEESLNNFSAQYNPKRKHDKDGNSEIKKGRHL